MLDWDKLRIFHIVAQAGSFTAAGDVLHLSQSAVSRQITALEESLKLSLFHRHARGLLLTEQGRILYSSTQDINQKLTLTQERLHNSTAKPSGILRVNVNIALGSMWIAPMIKDFKKEYPDIEVHIVCSDLQLDVAMLEADIAVLQHPSTALGLVQKKLMHNRVRAYASSEYLERRSTPQSAQDLENHDIIVYDTTLRSDDDYNSNWLLEVETKPHMSRRPFMAINNLHGMYRAVRAGAGIAALPEFMEGLPGGLINILPTIEGPEFNIYCVYPEEHKNTAKVQVFKNFLVEKSQEKR